MTFTQFNSRAGHAQIGAEVITALADLETRYGVKFDVNGGSLGSGSMVIKLQVTPKDTKAVEDKEKREFGYYCRQFGLEPDDYGLEVAYSTGKYRIFEVAPSRPKYPIGGMCLRTGKKFKFPRNMEAAIIKARNERDAQRLNEPEKPMSGFTAHF